MGGEGGRVGRSVHALCVCDHIVMLALKLLKSLTSFRNTCIQ